MPFTSTRSKSLAKSRKRDEHGHFVKEKDVKIKVAVDSPLEDPEQPVLSAVEGSRGTIIPEFEKPLVSVSINNPFKRILYWLDQIRRHQTTTFAIKLSIPLIALPVIIAGVFSLGRIYGINFQKSQSPISQIPLSSPTPQPPVILSRAGTLKIAKSAAQTRYLLLLKNGDLINLQIPQTIDLSKYANKQVLLTGLYDKTTGTLNVTDIAEIELFNATVIPQEATSSPIPK